MATDKEILRQSYGMALRGRAGNCYTCKEIVPILKEHLDPTPKPIDVQQLIDRIVILEKIITSKGYEIDEELLKES